MVTSPVVEFGERPVSRKSAEPPVGRLVVRRVGSRISVAGVDVEDVGPSDSDCFYWQWPASIRPLGWRSIPVECAGGPRRERVLWVDVGGLCGQPLLQGCSPNAAIAVRPIIR
jgi:hypothetical protein